MALRLSRLFGNTPEFWLNAQRAVDLWFAQAANEKAIVKIRPLNIVCWNSYELTCEDLKVDADCFLK